MNVYVFLFMPVKKLAQLIFCLQLTLVVCVWRISFRGFILSPRTTFKNSIQCVH